MKTETIGDKKRMETQTQFKTFGETENEIKAILLNRLSFVSCEKFKEDILYLKNKFSIDISKEYLKNLVSKEQSERETENRIYQLIQRTQPKTEQQNRHFKVYVFGYSIVKAKERLNFLKYSEN